jgi:hypothetical protein
VMSVEYTRGLLVRSIGHTQKIRFAGTKISHNEK